MKFITFFLILIFSVFPGKFVCQNSNNNFITGIVIDQNTKEKLPNANIFLSKTTIGTTSNSSGEFLIGNISEGTYTFVVSMIGFEPFVKKLELKKDSQISLNVMLKPKAVELSTVEVIADKSLYEQYLKEQYEYRKIFKKYFLGQTKFSEQCEILNEDKIVFKKNTLGFIEANCKEPINIINNALGYKIECVLEYFLCNDRRESVQMIFYPRFEILESEDEDIIDDWEENREHAYLSSLRRFLLSVINNEVQNKDYGIVLTNKTFNTQNISKAMLKYGSTNISIVDTVTHRTKLLFDEFLLVYNNITQEQSWIKLPFGEAEISGDGYAGDQFSLTVYSTFATHGIANFLPDDLVYDY